MFFPIFVLQAYTFQNACSMFTVWLNFFGFTVVVAVILFILGFHVAILVIYSFLYVCIRSLFVLVFVDSFVNLIIEGSSTAIPIDQKVGFFDDIWVTVLVTFENYFVMMRF